MNRVEVLTDTAPAPAGCYSQAVKAASLVFLSGQLPIDPYTGVLVTDNVSAMYRQTFSNLAAVCKAAGGSLDNVVRLNIYFTDPVYSAGVDQVMPEFFSKPYPARTRLTVAHLSRGACIEIDGIMAVPV